jgi:hypothetical protein
MAHMEAMKVPERNETRKLSDYCADPNEMSIKWFISIKKELRSGNSFLLVIGMSLLI